MLLPNAEGAWQGTNGFRLMPTDQLSEFPAEVTVMTAAGGYLTSAAYSWKHPEDGEQDGLLVIGNADEDGSLVAMWGDSWHQKPAPMMLSGRKGTDKTLELEGDYGGGWRWRVILDATDAENLEMRMDNVVPADQVPPGMPAEPYSAMIMKARRA